MAKANEQTLGKYDGRAKTEAIRPHVGLVAHAGSFTYASARVNHRAGYLPWIFPYPAGCCSPEPGRPTG